MFQPAIELTKTGDELSKIGDMVDYRIGLANNSSDGHPGSDVHDHGPDGGGGRDVHDPSGRYRRDPVTDFVIPEGATDPFVNTATVACSPVGFPNIYTD